jgi:hypothetical protein
MENLVKIAKAVQKFIAKEFLWILTALLVALLLASITKWGINSIAPQFEKEVLNIGFTTVEYYLILYAFYFVFVYLVRLVINAIMTLKKD